MNELIARFGDQVMRGLPGIDRLMVRGMLRATCKSKAWGLRE